MSKEKCCGCDAILEPGDFEFKREYRGECHGTPAYEDVAVCPECGRSDFEDAHEDEFKCDCCKDWTPNECESTRKRGVCQDCVPEPLPKAEPAGQCYMARK